MISVQIFRYSTVVCDVQLSMSAPCLHFFMLYELYHRERHVFQLFLPAAPTEQKKHEIYISDRMLRRLSQSREELNSIQSLLVRHLQIVLFSWEYPLDHNLACG